MIHQSVVPLLGEMLIFNTLMFTFTITMNNIGISSQFDCLPDGSPIPCVLRGRPSHSCDILKPPESSLLPAESPQENRARSPPARRLPPPARRFPPYSRSMTPPLRLPSSDGYGCELEQLPFIRLNPLNNPQQIFKLQRYTFPANKPLEIRIGKHKYEPMPTQEQIVLSTSDGDVFAILETFNTLAGMYTNNNSNKKRAKINIVSGRVSSLTKEQVIEIPVGPSRTIFRNYMVQHLEPHVNDDHLHQ